MLRIVADTNIYISGTFWPGIPRLFLSLARHEVFELVCSKQILRELDQTLKGRKFQLSDHDIGSLLSDVMSYTVPLEAPALSVPKLRDRKNAHLCSLAMHNKASYLVTGDNDLLVLDKVGSVKILTARAILEKEFSELLDAFEGQI